MIRVIQNNTAPIRTQGLVITIYVTTNKPNSPNSNKHTIIQQ